MPITRPGWASSLCLRPSTTCAPSAPPCGPCSPSSPTGRSSTCGAAPRRSWSATPIPTRTAGSLPPSGRSTKPSEPSGTSRRRPGSPSGCSTAGAAPSVGAAGRPTPRFSPSPTASWTARSNSLNRARSSPTSTATRKSPVGTWTWRSPRCWRPPWPTSPPATTRAPSRGGTRSWTAWPTMPTPPIAGSWRPRVWSSTSPPRLRSRSWGR